jgi:hypothetical protein
MTDNEAILSKSQQLGGTPHAFILGIASDVFENLVIGQFEGGLDPGDGILIRQAIVSGKYGFGGIGKDSTGHLAGCRPAHAIGDQAVAARFGYIVDIFVVGANVAYIRNAIISDGRWVL